jgi:hypothetical protein
LKERLLQAALSIFFKWLRLSVDAAISMSKNN